MHYHDELLREKAARASRETVEYEWDVPPERIYNDRYAARPSERHALQPFYEQKDASKPERAFVSFLESQPQWIRWWYKNGEKNKEDFAVSYQDARGLTRSFYVDFVICLANNIVCLFDTKTLHSDIEFCAKHNALFAYIQHLNQTRNTAYVGGVIVPENDVWRYPNRLIATAESTAGWAVFNPAALAQQEFQS
jgi:type III restriction enzyme